MDGDIIGAAGIVTLSVSITIVSITVIVDFIAVITIAIVIADDATTKIPTPVDISPNVSITIPSRNTSRVRNWISMMK